MNQIRTAKDKMKTKPVPPSDGKKSRAASAAAPVVKSTAPGGNGAPPPPMTEICARYQKLYAGLVFDVLEHMGVTNTTLSHEIMPLTLDMKLAGPAFTMKGTTTAVKDEQFRYRRLKAIKDMTHPCVEVRDAGTSRFNVALYGELTATTARAHGAVGAVVDGGTRDSGMVISMGFPLFAKYRSPVEAFGRVITLEHQVPILMSGELTETVVVNPGDFIFGDLDGIIVVPKHLTLPVLVEAERVMGIEDAARVDFKRGDDPVEVFNKHKRL
jgi:4-hydroxy-4-methyl-2-oxoglutarate aldolase